MASKIEKLENNMQKISIEVGVEEFKKAMNAAYLKNKSRFAVPGFRKGKAPFAIVVNYYGESVLYEDAIDIAMQPAYEEALKEHNLKPYSRPAVDVESVGMDKGLTFTCEFAVKPEVKLGQYAGVTAYRPAVEVSEEEIDKLIERDRMRASRLVPVEDRAVADGDLVTIDYKGSVDGVPFQGGSAENYELKIGSKTFIPGFEDQLIGHKDGESFDINVKFPEDYHAEDLKGKDAVFAVTIHGIKMREMPEVDDEFIKDISEDCNTVAEYREHLKADQEKAQNERADREFEGRAVDEAVKNAEVEVPAAAVEDEMDHMLQEQRQQLAYQGLRLEDYLKYLNINMQVFRAQLREPAANRLKRDLVLEAVAAKENLSVDEAELDKRFEDMAAVYQRSAEELKAGFNEENIEALKEQLLLEKAARFIREKAVATDVKPVEEHEHDEHCGCGHDHDHDEHCECDHDHEEHEEK